MTDLYENIPTEQIRAYEENAERVVDEVVQGLGEQAVTNATDITKQADKLSRINQIAEGIAGSQVIAGAEKMLRDDAQAEKFATDVEQFTRSNVMQDRFMQAMEQPGNGIAPAAEAHANSGNETESKSPFIVADFSNPAEARKAIAEHMREQGTSDAENSSPIRPQNPPNASGGSNPTA